MRGGNGFLTTLDADIAPRSEQSVVGAASDSLVQPVGQAPPGRLGYGLSGFGTCVAGVGPTSSGSSSASAPSTLLSALALALASVPEALPWAFSVPAALGMASASCFTPAACVKRGTFVKFQLFELQECNVHSATAHDVEDGRLPAI